MPSTSPGTALTAVPRVPSKFEQVLPGSPTKGLQTFSSFIFRQKRYVAYISGCDLNILSGPNVLVHVLSFDQATITLSAEPATGKLAVSTESEVWVLEPVAEGWSKVRWTKTLLLKRDANGEPRTLSWGNEGELLVGDRSFLTLFSTIPSSRSSSPSASPIESGKVDERGPLWAKRIPSPVKACAFSPTGSLIASTGGYDRFVKIWRRLSFEEGLFDYAYLAHPTTVTHLQWRSFDDTAEARRGSGISRRHDEDQEILYTIAADGVLRVWKTGGANDIDVLILYTSINLVDAIPPLPETAVAFGSDNSTRYAWIIPAHEFSQAVAAAVASAVGMLNRDKVSHTLEHLKEVSSKEPDIFITTDGSGRMSAWGLQNVGHRRRPDTPSSKEPFHITHAEDFPLEFSTKTNVTFQIWFDNDQINILAHCLENTSGVGEICWWTGHVEQFFSHSTTGSERLLRSCEWTGHANSLTELGLSGSSLASKDEGGELIYWEPTDKGLRFASTPPTSSFFDHRPSRQWSGASGNEVALISDSKYLRRCKDIVVITTEKDLTIFSLRGHYVEHFEAFPTVIEGISLAKSTHALAVAFGSHVNVYVRSRYHEVRTWHLLKQVSLEGFGAKLSAVSWTADNKIAIAAGKGIFVVSDRIFLHELPQPIIESLDFGLEGSRDVDLEQIAYGMSSHLPLWHPSSVSQFILWGRSNFVIKLLERLHYKLKFYGDGDDLDWLLGFNEKELLATTDLSTHRLDPEVADKLLDQLKDSKLPKVTHADQTQLGLAVAAFAFVMRYRDGLDGNAQRYLFIWKLKLEELKSCNSPSKKVSDGNPLSTNGVPQMSWREIAFAFHSNTQQPLLDLLILHHDNKLDWATAGSLGIVRWLSEPEARAQVFETIAQSEYRSSKPPDPVDGTLFYLALRKKQTLIALWRIATWHKEQKSTMNFLRRDFSQPEARTAARKNAYALMGKRRFKYAAAFFLLAEDAGSATSVLAGQCGDIPLAIAVARVYCGDKSPELCKLLEERVLPRARETCDRWLLCWIQSVMGNGEFAALELIRPIDGIDVRYWQQDDPVTLVLYQELRREKRKEEWAAVTGAINILLKMGLTVSAMQLAASYSFMLPSVVPEVSARSDHANANGNAYSSAPSLLDHFNQPSKVSDAQSRDGSVILSTSQPSVNDTKSAREAQAAELLRKLKAKKDDSSNQAHKTKSKEQVDNEEKNGKLQFKEPDPSSFLDSFGL